MMETAASAAKPPDEPRVMHGGAMSDEDQVVISDDCMVAEALLPKGELWKQANSQMICVGGVDADEGWRTSGRRIWGRGGFLDNRKPQRP